MAGQNFESCRHMSLTNCKTITIIDCIVHTTYSILPTIARSLYVHYSPDEGHLTLGHLVVR